VLAWQGRPEEAEPLLQQAERALRDEAEPVAGLGIRYTRGVLELARGRDADALAAFQAAEQFTGRLAAPNPLVTAVRAMLAQILVRLGETEHAEQAIAGLGEQDRERGEIRISTAMLRLAQDDPHAAMAALVPVLDGSAPLFWPAWLTQAFLLEAIAQNTLGDPGAAESALERALDLAEPDSALEALSDSEIRVLRYLPTSLSAPQIAGELYLSHNTVRTHMRHLYAKLGTHRRADTVARARALGLLAPSARHRTAQPGEQGR
jgi:LuxR family maltose regulon positive regulatory protein